MTNLSITHWEKKRGEKKQKTLLNILKYTLIYNFKIREFNFKIKDNFGTYLKHRQVSTQYFNINLTKFGQTNVKGENIFSFQVWGSVSFLQILRGM